MTARLLVLALASLLLAIGATTLIGPRRLLEGVAIIALAVPLAIVIFVAAVAGLVVYRLHGG